MQTIKNYHALVITYLGPTNHRGSRIRIKSDRFEQAVTIPYNYEFNNIKKHFKKTRKTSFQRL
jgi:hypothetical protein